MWLIAFVFVLFFVLKNLFFKTKGGIFVSDQIVNVMDLNIFVSKKGTRVVLATELYQALQLPTQHYPATVKRWINDYYEFSDGIRKPLKMQEFATRKTEDNVLWNDYYLSVAFAKQIVLRSRSKVKQKYARQLALESVEETPKQLSGDQFRHLVEITKAMTLISCQEECERRHLRRYKERNEGSASNWWRYRAEVLGYDTDSLREKLRRRGVVKAVGNQRDLLAQYNPLELIRAGVVDLFMAIGKSQQYALQMGTLAKDLAETMGLQLINDHQKIDLFTEAVDPELVHQLKEPLNKHLMTAAAA